MDIDSTVDDVRSDPYLEADLRRAMQLSLMDLDIQRPSSPPADGEPDTAGENEEEDDSNQEPDGPSEGKESSILDRLPPELILCITDVLPTQDAISLRLCSRYLYEATRRLHLTIPDQQERFAFLSTISRATPGVFCCHACAKLHRISDIPHPAGRNLLHPCLDVSLASASRCDDPLDRFLAVHSVPTAYRFRKCHLAAAMKSHFSGQITKTGLTIESLGYTEVVHREDKPDVTTLLSIQAKVLPSMTDPGKDLLVLQVQNWVLLHDQGKRTPRPSWLGAAAAAAAAAARTRPTVDMDMDMDLCRAMSWFELCRHERMVESFDAFCGSECAARRAGKHGPLYRSCEICHVVYTFQPVRRVGPEDGDARDGGGRAVVSTKWVVLGEGVDVEDKDWKRTTVAVEREGMDMRRAEGLALRFGSDPTSRNQALLEEKNYCRVLDLKMQDMWSSGPVGTPEKVKRSLSYCLASWTIARR